MIKKMKMQMKNITKTIAFAVMITGAAAAFTSPAFAISSVDECQSAVKSATKDLLKANVKMEALGDIDAALVAAEAKCAAEDFAGAAADLANAKSLMAAAAQN